MNERELIGAKLEALDAADASLDALLAAGTIDFEQHEAATRETMRNRDRLTVRREKLVETGSGVTPVIGPEQIARLREVVRRLQLRNANEAAIRALIGEALTIGEAIAAPAGAPATWARRGRGMLVPAAMAVAAGAAVMATIAMSKRGRRRERGRRRGQKR